MTDLAAVQVAASSSDIDKGDRPGWRVVAASVTGAGHLEVGRESQDSFQTNTRAINDPVLRARGWSPPLVVATADGAGSALYGAAGAALATAFAQGAATALLAKLDWATTETDHLHQLLLDVIEKARSAVLTATSGDRTPGAQTHDFLTTLQVAVWNPPWVAIGQVGDGFAVLEREGELCLLAADSPPAEYGNVAYFLNQQEPTEPNTKVFCDKRISGLALSTDGLREVVLEFENGVRPVRPKKSFFIPLFAGVASGEYDTVRTMKLLRSPKIMAAAEDDLTLVVATAQR